MGWLALCWVTFKTVTSEGTKKSSYRGRQLLPSVCEASVFLCLKMARLDTIRSRALLDTVRAREDFAGKRWKFRADRSSTYFLVSTRNVEDW